MKTTIFYIFISILLYLIFLEKDIQIEKFCLLSGILPLKVYNNLYNPPPFALDPWGVEINLEKKLIK